MSEETGDNGKFFELLATAVAGGSTVRAAAESCSCSERQGYRISATHEFKSRVSEIRSEMTNAAVGELSAAASEAVATIRELLDSTNESSVRLNAAKAILNTLGPLSELAELRERLDALERGE
jgi:HEAT repeat protein